MKIAPAIARFMPLADAVASPDRRAGQTSAG